MRFSCCEGLRRCVWIRPFCIFVDLSWATVTWWMAYHVKYRLSLYHVCSMEKCKKSRSRSPLVTRIELGSSLGTSLDRVEMCISFRNRAFTSVKKLRALYRHLGTARQPWLHGHSLAFGLHAACARRVKPTGFRVGTKT